MAKRKTKPPMPAGADVGGSNLDESVEPRKAITVDEEVAEVSGDNLDESVEIHKEGSSDRFEAEEPEEEAIEPAE